MQLDIIECTQCNSDQVARYTWVSCNKQYTYDYPTMDEYAKRIHQPHITNLVHTYPPNERLECMNCGYTIQTKHPGSLSISGQDFIVIREGDVEKGTKSNRAKRTRSGQK